MSSSKVNELPASSVNPSSVTTVTVPRGSETDSTGTNGISIASVIKPAVSDGNCFYDSFVKAVREHPSANMIERVKRVLGITGDLTIQSVRDAVAGNIPGEIFETTQALNKNTQKSFSEEYSKSKKALFDSVGNSTNAKDFNKELSAIIRTDKEWADNVDVAILSELLQKGGLLLDIISGDKRTQIPPFDNNTIMIVYNGENHYDYIAPAAPAAPAAPVAVPATATANIAPVVAPVVAPVATLAAPTASAAPLTPAIANTVPAPVPAATSNTSTQPVNKGIAIGEHLFVIPSTSMDSQRRKQYFDHLLDSSKPPAELVEEELEVLKALGITEDIQRKLAGFLPDLFDSLPQCSTDASMMLKKECEKAYYVLWSTLYAIQRETENAIEENRATRSSLSDINVSLDQRFVESLKSWDEEEISNTDIMTLFTVIGPGEVAKIQEFSDEALMKFFTIPYVEVV